MTPTAPQPLIFLNLSNGVAWPGEFDGLVRIQSTWLEQKLWSRVIEDLDYSFLVPVWMGRDVRVVDVSAQKAESRAIYQGLPWIRFCIYAYCSLKYGSSVPPAMVRGHDVSNYFFPQFTELSKEAMDKLRYVDRVTPSHSRSINISGISLVSGIDGNEAMIHREVRRIYG